MSENALSLHVGRIEKLILYPGSEQDQSQKTPSQIEHRYVKPHTSFSLSVASVTKQYKLEPANAGG